MAEPVLVLEGGGMRNAYLSGVLTEWTQAGLDFSDFGRIYACSSAAHTAAFLLAGQIELTRRVWLELTSPDIFHPLNPLRRRKLGDVDRLVDGGCAGLDLAAFADNPTRLFINVFSLVTHELEYVEATPNNLRDLLKACCVVPRWARPVDLNGIPCADGGIADPFPVMKAVQDGADQILAVSNRTEGFQVRGFSRTHVAPWAMFAGYPEARRVFQSLSVRYAETKRLLREPPPGLHTLCVRPEKELPAGIFERRPHVVRQTYRAGMQTARQNLAAVRAFLAPQA